MTTNDADKLAAALAVVESIRVKARTMREECDRLEASLRAQWGGEPEPVTVDEARKQKAWCVCDTTDCVSVVYAPVAGAAGLTWDAAVAQAERLATRRGFVRWGTNRWAPALPEW